MLTLVLALALTAAPDGGPPPDAGSPEGFGLRASFKAPSTLILTAGKAHRVDLSGYGGEGIEAVRILGVVRGEKAMYLLLDVVNGGNPGNPGGHCGAGNESYLVWLALSPAFKILEGQKVLYESCSFSIGEPGVHPSCASDVAAGKSCTIELPNGKQTVRYDAAHPEAGLKIEGAKLEH